jgi:hypothetical protein
VSCAAPAPSWVALTSAVMTIAELTGRIDERIRTAREGIARLQAARDALAERPDPTTIAPSTSARPPRARKAAAPTRSARERQRSRQPKPVAVLALARELDAGLRTRV